MQTIPGVADAHIVQVLDYPALQVDVDRLRAAQARHLAARRRQQHADLAVVERAGQRRTYFLNPQNNVNYTVAVQTPIDTDPVGRTI